MFPNGGSQPFTPVFCIPFPDRWTLVIAFIGLLVTTSNIPSFIKPLSLNNFLVYRRLEKSYTTISSVIDLSKKFVDYRLNYFIRSRQVHRNNRWHKFHVTTRKLFGCMDHKMAWLYFSENDVFDSFVYAIHWVFAMVSLVVELAQWLIQEHCSC